MLTSRRRSPLSPRWRAAARALAWGSGVMRLAWLAWLAWLACALGCGGGETDKGGGPEAPAPLPTFEYALDDVLRLNQIQAKGTHNSYHVEPDAALDDWRYTHAPLDQQLALQGVRKVELDTHYNEESGAFEVYHIEFLDEQTTCRRFTECLAAMKAWSDAFPAHHPIFVQIEPKDALAPETADAYFERFEAEILSVWPRERIVTPDLVKGSAASLRDAVTGAGWPTLGEVRARILFFMNEAGPFRDHYTRGGSDLDSRLMFVESDTSAPKPYDAIYILNDPVAQAAAIADAVGAGFLVRTRADSDNDEPLAGDTARRDAAFASGAQLISTDYPAPVEGVAYVVEVPGGTPSRCNPLDAPPECTPEAVEDPGYFKAP